MSDAEGGDLNEKFASKIEMLEAIRDYAKEIAGVSIHVTNQVVVTRPTGEKVIPDGCCTIELLNGKQLIIHRDDVELLLNDGLLQRLNIPITLVTRKS